MKEAAFQTLKQKLCSAPILELGAIVVYFDASHKGLGTMLMQKESVIAYASYQNELNMRQHRWLELLSDYNCEIRYHPRKVNVVADALSRKVWIKTIRVRALVMTVGLNLSMEILKAQNEENYGNEDLGGIIKKLESCTEQNIMFE
nr:reverse transcriptase domain-containing protein [Tanacetum cinerariifolium]